jgi:hypothetical protein
VGSSPGAKNAIDHSRPNRRDGTRHTNKWPLLCGPLRQSLSELAKCQPTALCAAAVAAASIPFLISNSLRRRPRTPRNPIKHPRPLDKKAIGVPVSQSTLALYYTVTLYLSQVFWRDQGGHRTVLYNKYCVANLLGTVHPQTEPRSRQSSSQVPFPNTQHTTTPAAHPSMRRQMLFCPCPTCRLTPKMPQPQTLQR